MIGEGWKRDKANNSADLVAAHLQTIQGTSDYQILLKEFPSKVQGVVLNRAENIQVFKENVMLLDSNGFELLPEFNEEGKDALTKEAMNSGKYIAYKIVNPETSGTLIYTKQISD